ncbi:MAG: GDYXXLXY domain-containing protein [Opitutaceae bacterium]|jgi:uncharacterized membrane-anchored protein|nr:GDYXXLXY domain-containing protein [Opitutaceae bacterium]
MRTLKLRLILLAVFAAVTLAVPLGIIWRHEATLRHGALHKFRAAPVDPYDAFRGRYVQLSFADNTCKRADADGDAQGGSLWYVRLGVDAEGFSVPVEAGRKPPKDGDFLIVDEAGYYSGEKSLRINYPFTRYYLPEDIAPEAEALYRKTTRNNLAAPDASGDEKRKPTYAAVRVRNGAAVIEELFIGGVPVRDALKAQGKDL